MIAKQIIKIAQAGVHDAAQLSALAVAEPAAFHPRRPGCDSEYPKASDFT